MLLSSARGRPPAVSDRRALPTLLRSYRTEWLDPGRRGQHCIQLASGFYEWRVDEYGRKAPYLITMAEQELFGFAALWDRRVREVGTAVKSCVHITMLTNELLAEIHNTGNSPHRMPAILRGEDRETWLTGTPEEARAVLRQYPATSWTVTR